LSITPLGAAGTIESISLDTTAGDKTGSLSLGSGFYLITVSLDNGIQAAVKTEVAHIYKNMETKGEFIFAAKDFADVIRIGGRVTNTKFPAYDTLVKVRIYRADNGTEVIPVSGGTITAGTEPGTGTWQMALNAAVKDVPLNFRVELKKSADPARLSRITPLPIPDSAIPIRGMQGIALTVEGYTVTADGFTNGSISPSETETFEGIMVNLAIDPAAGYQLKTGTLTYNGISIDETAPAFTMPREDVVISAEFESVPKGGNTGLFIGDSATGVSGLLAALAAVKTHAEDTSDGVSGGVYTIVLAADETYTTLNNLTYTGNPAVRITLQGRGVLRRVKSPFTVGSNVTLVLEDKIWLTGMAITNTTDNPVRVNSGGTLIMEEGSRITGNTVGGTSSSRSYPGGGVYINAGTFTMNGGIISGNTAITSVTSSASLYGGGGGVYVTGTGATHGEFTMNGGTISGNIAQNNSGGSSASPSSSGAGVYVDTYGDFFMEGGIISGNDFISTGLYPSSLFSGGGVYSAGRFKLSGGTISGNGASGGKAGVYLGGGTFTMTGGSITDHPEAGVYIYGVGTYDIGGSAIISDNGASGVYVGGTGGVSLTISGGTIRNNTATGNGGGVYVRGSNVTLFISGGTISDNTTTGSGGGVNVEGLVGTLTISGGTISNNTATGNGGGVYFSTSFSGGTLTISGGTISGNRAGNGGGVFFTNAWGGNSGLLTISGGTISNNTATGNGGGVYFHDPHHSLTISGGTISNNTATGNGGGVFFSIGSGGGTLTISDGTISNNTTTGNGGGVFLTGNTSPGPLTMSGGTISGNHAANGGGVDGGSVTISGNAKIENNTATGNGGGVNGTTITMSGGTISGNRAVSGGGAYVTGASTMSGGTVSNNTASRGDGIFSSAGVTIDGTPTITGGNGIHLGGSGSITLTTTTAFTGNVPVDLDSGAAAGRVILVRGTGYYADTAIPLPVSRFPLRNFVATASPYAATPILPFYAIESDGKLGAR
jgi:hypothetical protein